MLRHGSNARNPGAGHTVGGADIGRCRAGLEPRRWLRFEPTRTHTDPLVRDTVDLFFLKKKSEALGDLLAAVADAVLELDRRLADHAEVAVRRHIVRGGRRQRFGAAVDLTMRLTAPCRSTAPWMLCHGFMVRCRWTLL